MAIKLWSLAGNRQALDGGAMFGNAPRAVWSKWMPADAENRVELACRCLLAQLPDGRRVLFETGIGAFFEPKLRERYGVVEAEHVLLASLAAIGLSDADIDIVVLSHLHFDHAGGLLAAHQPGQPLRLLFPNARILVSAACFERAREPHPRDRASFIPGFTDLLLESGRLELVDAEYSPTLAPWIRFEYSHGHTPGLMLSEIGGDGGIVYCADLIPGRAWVHVPITMGYDRYPELLIDEKASFLADKLARGVRLYYTHDPAAAASGLVQRDGRYIAEPVYESLEALELAA